MKPSKILTLTIYLIIFFIVASCGKEINLDEESTTAEVDDVYLVRKNGEYLYPTD
jgi:hypothetical protein